MKQFQSKFRKNRSEQGGDRAQANKLKAKPTMEQEETLEEQIAPGIHDEVTRRARELHITHDHAAGRHHVTAMHEDGSVEETDHATPEEAHDHAAMAAGVGNYPEKHKSPEGEAPDGEDYAVEPLD